MAEATNGIEELSQIFECLSNAADAYSSVTDLIAVLNGSDNGSAAVLAAIQNLGNIFTQGVAEIVAALKASDWQTQWNSYFVTPPTGINAIQTGTANIAADFATLQLQLDSAEYVVNVGLYVPFHIWAGGGEYEGQTYPAALMTLQDLATNLWDLFESGGEANASMLQTWGELVALGANNAVENFAGQTALTAYFLLMQQIYGMLSTIFYYHETMLALYINLYGDDKGFTSLSSFVTERFGAFNQPSTAWGQFNTAMAVWPVLPADYNIIATSGDSWTGQDAYYVINSGGGAPGAAQFWNQWTRTSQYPQYTNAVFTNLQIAIDTSNSQDFPNYYLVGTLAEVQAGVNFVQQGTITSYNAAEMNGPDSNQYMIYVNSQANVGYVNVGYNVAPACDVGPNSSLVITGFCFVVVDGNRLGVQVEYSQLDLSDPNNPVVTLIGDATAPVGDYFGVEGNSGDNHGQYVNYIDLRPSGTSVSFPIDNVSLIQTCETNNGNRIGLLVRSGWPAFTFSFMQPTTLAAEGYQPSAC